MLQKLRRIVRRYLIRHFDILHIRTGGSITVEASYLLPIVIFTIFSFLYLAFFLHDRGILQGITDEAVHKATIMFKQEVSLQTGEIRYERIGDRDIFYGVLGDRLKEEKDLNQYLSEKFKGKLLLYRISSIDTAVTNKNITVKVEAKAKVEFPFLRRLMNPFQSIAIVEEGRLHNPAEMVRLSEVILDTGSNIKGFEELRESLEKLIKKK